MANLEEMHFHGRMSLDNILDVDLLANVILSNSRLKSIELRDFVDYAKDHYGTIPLLDSLFKAAATLGHLENFTVECFASYKLWDRAFCASDALKPLCKSSCLVSLHLCGIGLLDEHSVTIAEKIASNSETRIRGLRLNSNVAMDAGVEALAELIHQNDTIQRLEAHSARRLTRNCEIN